MSKKKTTRAVRVATHRHCAGCGELFVPQSILEKVCSQECRPLADQEAEKAQIHAEKVKRGEWD